MSTPQRIALVVVAAVIVVGGFVVLKGSSDDGKATSSTAGTTTNVAQQASTAATTGTPSQATTTAPARQEPQVDVVGGKPKGGIEKITVNKGDQVRFRVNSDVADEIHVHGYDLMKDVTAGGDVTFAFEASIEGVFEIELENAGVQIAELTVEP